MRAMEPAQSGHVRRKGVRIAYEVYGEGTPALLLLPAWSIVHARMWKAQIPFLARHYRVVVVDGRGNGRSDRPKGADAYRSREFVADAIAVMDAAGVRTAVVLGFSFGGHLAALLAARHPERVTAAVMIAPAAPFGPSRPQRRRENFTRRDASPRGWDKYNEHYWRANYADFAQFFFERVFIEPHSTKQVEDAVGWAMETDPETLIDTVHARFVEDDGGEETYARVRCPVLVIQGDRDDVIPYAKGVRVAELCGGRLVTMEGSGHAPHMRDPAQVNLLVRDFVDKAAALPLRSVPQRIRRGLLRAKRALYLSSPIGLGHARRDVAIANALRELEPALAIDWLTQHPVTALLERLGERVHPVSGLLASECDHIEAEAGEHSLHIFQALRRMDEILIANFLRFQDVVEEERYDLVIADEAWEVDYYWHEHPELKRGALAWLTDFVGYMPMPGGDARERRLTADYNAEMIAHVERYPRVRDRAIFVGNPEDILPGRFGPGLPEVRNWTERHFAFSGYVLGADPASWGARDALRQRLGYAPGDKVCVAAVGGSALGAPLLKRTIAAFGLARRDIPALRMIAAAGPRIPPDSLPCEDGVEVRGFVPDLPMHLAACDLALVQGGLTTCMELAAARTPFLYFPLRGHFEQNLHVRHRLERYRAGRCIDYHSAGPQEIADAIVAGIVAGIGGLADCRDVERDGAIRAARMIAELI